MSHQYEGKTCVVTGLPLAPGDVLIMDKDESVGVKAVVWRRLPPEEKQALREAVQRKQAISPVAESPKAETKRGGREQPADSQQGS